jgi:hypothetical protein
MVIIPDLPTVNVDFNYPLNDAEADRDSVSDTHIGDNGILSNPGGVNWNGIEADPGGPLCFVEEFNQSSSVTVALTGGFGPFEGTSTGDGNQLQDLGIAAPGRRSRDCPKKPVESDGLGQRPWWGHSNTLLRFSQPSQPGEVSDKSDTEELPLRLHGVSPSVPTSNDRAETWRAILRRA